ncbi:hypothetical protein [Aeromonas caviae]|uniref:hypothetical protein n=1 Tax=Aeromonas caviae TaxID=648 RepID=UPI002B49F849|nr:hypothetical protein [Aeromonas caviae]
MSLVEHAYENKGGLKQQRPPLKTASAKDIRDRMVGDLTQGAVLPPVVIGVVSAESLEKIASSIKDKDDVELFLRNVAKDNISIIDGMQRTTALLEALTKEPIIKDNTVRVELWIANSVSPLIYRMLILNTGQIPWDITRQLDTVYSSLLVEIQKCLPAVSIFTKDLNSRRTNAGEYQSSHIIELYMIFSSREAEIDIKQHLQSDFSRLNIIETSSHSEFLAYFIDALSMMVTLDHAWSRVKASDIINLVEEDGISLNGWKIKSGQDILKSAPARAGLLAAISTKIFDSPGFDIDWDDAKEKSREAKKIIDSLVIKMNAMNNIELSRFLCLEVLNERLNKKSGKVGEFERGVYYKSFTAMIEYARKLESMKPCWVKL